MYVIEVRPKQAWRGLRFAKEGAPLRARVTSRHPVASHWFQRATADWVVNIHPEVRSAGRVLDLAWDRWRIVECACSPRSLQ
jgi:hypothetical protein